MGTDDTWAGAERRTFDTREILRDSLMQVRNKLDAGTIAKYASAYLSGVDLGPVKVAIADGVPNLCDGWHRMAAREQLWRQDRAVPQGGLEWTQVDALVIETSRREAFWLAAKANTTHGLPLKKREVRRVFNHFVQARKHRKPDGSLMSYREIAKEIGGTCHFTTVREWMIKDHPKIAAEMGGEDGRVTGGERKVHTAGYGDAITAAVQTILAAFPGVTDQHERGEHIEMMREALSIMESGGRYIEPQF